MKKNKTAVDNISEISTTVNSSLDTLDLPWDNSSEVTTIVGGDTIEIFDVNGNPQINLKDIITGKVTTYPSSVTVDDYGRVTSIIQGATPVTSANLHSTTSALIIADSVITPGNIDFSLDTDLNAISALTSKGMLVRVDDGTYNTNLPSTDGKVPVFTTGGVVSWADPGGSGGSGITSLTVGTGLTANSQEGGTLTTAGTIGLTNTVTSATYTNPSSVTVNAQGRITAITNGTSPTAGTVTNITTGTGLTGGPITNSGTISLSPSGVTANTYTNPSSVAVDTYGRITTITSGAAPTNGTVTSVAITPADSSVTVNGSPITSAGTITIGVNGELKGLSTLNGNGVVVRTGLGTYGATKPSSNGQILSGQTDGTISWIAAGGTGTVTNVGLSAGSPALTVTNSPVTSSGVINIDASTELKALSSITTTTTAGLVNRGSTGVYSVNAPSTNGQIPVYSTTGAITWTTPTSGGTGTVTSVTAGTGLTSSPVGGITTTGSLSLTPTAVSVGTYAFPKNLTVDTYGRITALSQGDLTISVASLTTTLTPSLTNATLSLVPNGTGTLQISNLKVTNYTTPSTNITPNVTTIGTTIAPINATSLILQGTGTGVVRINSHLTLRSGNELRIYNPDDNAAFILKADNTFTSPQTYTVPIAYPSSGTKALVSTVDGIMSWGNIGTGTVTSITAGVGLTTTVGSTGGSITGAGTLNLTTTGVTSASYTNMNATVDAYGRITAASNGASGSTGDFTFSGTTMSSITDPTTNFQFVPASSSSIGIYIGSPRTCSINAPTLQYTYNNTRMIVYPSVNNNGMRVNFDQYTEISAPSMLFCNTGILGDPPTASLKLGSNANPTIDLISTSGVVNIKGASIGIENTTANSAYIVTPNIIHTAGIRLFDRSFWSTPVIPPDNLTLFVADGDQLYWKGGTGLKYKISMVAA